MCCTACWGCRCYDTELDALGLSIVRCCVTFVKRCNIKGKDPGESRGVTEKKCLFLILLN